MNNYFENLTAADIGGHLRPVVGASVRVTIKSTGVAAVIYSDNGVTLQANPMTTASLGFFEFYAADEEYVLTITGPTINTITRTVTLEDPDDGLTVLAAPGGAALVGTTPAGTLAAGTVQAALNELDTEKASLTALAASTGDSLVGHIGSSTGSVATTVQEVLRRQVSALDFMTAAERADVISGAGVLDVTVSVQKALDSGARSVRFPSGTYRCSTLVMPTTPYFTIYGDGPGSMLMQNGGGMKLLTWNTAAIAYNNQTVRDLGFDGTNGANNIIDTTGAGGLTIDHIYFKNIPTGFTGLFVNGAAATYVHDIRINGLQYYSATAGHSAVRFGPLTSDTSISNVIGNGQFACSYFAYYDIGAVTIRMSDSHPYNANINVIHLAGNNDDCTFDNVVLDNATNDVFTASNSARLTFTDVWCEAIKSGYSGMNFVGCTAVSAYNCQFSGAAGAASCVTADSGCTDMRIIGGNLGTLANYVTPFSLAGARSYATAIAGYNPLGLTYSFSGATTAVQAQNTTQFLGVNAGQALINNTYYLVPEAGTVDKFRVETSNTPAAGQTFIFNLQKNGSTIGTVTLNNGDFSGTITPGTSVAQYDTVAIQSVFSATSGSSNVRYSVRFKA